VGNMASSHVTVGSGDLNHVVQHALDNSAVEAFAVLYETPAALAASIQEFPGRD
jgi:hypothetical protein